MARRAPSDIASPKPPQPEEGLVERWERVLGHGRIRPHVAAAVPARVLLLDWFDVDVIDHELAEDLLTRPTHVLWAGYAALRERIPEEAGRPAPRLRVRHLPLEVSIRELGGAHLGRLVSVEGLVKRASKVEPRVDDAFFKCLRCDGIIQEPQDDHVLLKEPLQCYEDQGGCGHSTGFKLLAEKCSWVDGQTLEIQEPPDALHGREQPQRLTLQVDDDLTRVAVPGDRVLAVGILRGVPRKVSGGRARAMTMHLQVVSLERRQLAYEDVVVTDEEEATIRALAGREDLFDHLAASVAPNIWGMQQEKLSIALQLFGGVEHGNADGTANRGDIHILLLGDPGVAKSALLRAVAKLAPRSVMASGKGSSAAGLTASVQKDEDSGQWTFEGGALVLADRGLCVIDELDKMDDHDRGSIHGALEQGTVTINKAGIVGLTLNARCPVLAAGNPRDGRFDPALALADQVELDPALLSRFDVIWLLLDRPHAARDTATMEHILLRRGQEPPIAAALFRKYVALARRSAEPRLTDAAMARIRDFYVQLRQQGAQPDAPIPATPRQGEAILRLAEATARARLRGEVLVEDVEQAIRLVETSLRRYALNHAGQLDIDKALTATSSTQRDAIHRILLIVDELERAANASPHGAHRLDVLAAAHKQGIPNAAADAIIERLVTDGRLSQPRGEHYRRV